MVLILALGQYLKRDRPGLLAMATGFGILSVLCLIGNATLSLFATFQAATEDPEGLFGGPLYRMIGVLAMAAIILDGLWLLLVSWTGLKSQQFPNSLSYLGLGMGILSLVPPLGILVLILSLFWSLWVGQVLLKGEPIGHVSGAAADEANP